MAMYVTLCDRTNLHALREAGSDDLSSFNTETIQGEIEARHDSVIGKDIR
jgi:hypothetical protein